mgnify:CR=1 FL=1
MVKIKVLKSFIDKYTGMNHPEGEVFEATPERIAEIQKVDRNLIEVMKERPVKKKEVGVK